MNENHFEVGKVKMQNKRSHDFRTYNLMKRYYFFNTYNYYSYFYDLMNFRRS